MDINLRVQSFDGGANLSKKWESRDIATFVEGNRKAVKLGGCQYFCHLMQLPSHDTASMSDCTLTVRFYHMHEASTLIYFEPDSGRADGSGFN